jgi:hypothetical protein
MRNFKWAKLAVMLNGFHSWGLKISIEYYIFINTCILKHKVWVTASYEYTLMFSW